MAGLDPMDFEVLVQRPEEPTSPAPHEGFHQHYHNRQGQHQPQHQRCPYYHHTEHQQYQQQRQRQQQQHHDYPSSHHGLSLPRPRPHSGSSFSIPPLPDFPLPQAPLHRPVAASAADFHSAPQHHHHQPLHDSQAQPQPQPAPQIQPQIQPQTQPQIQPQIQPQSQPQTQPQTQPQLPVSNQQLPPLQQPALPLPHPHLYNYAAPSWYYPSTPWPGAHPSHAIRPSGPESLFGASGVAGAGPGQHLLVPHHEPWIPLPFSFQADPLYSRFPSAALPAPSQHGRPNSQQNHESGQSRPSQAAAMSAAERGGAANPPSPRPISLPSMNPSPNPLSTPATAQATSGQSGQPGPVALPPPIRHPPFFNPSEASRLPNPSSSANLIPQLPRPTLFGMPEPLQRTDAAPEADQRAALGPGPYTLGSSGRPPHNTVRRFVQPPSDYNSDEEDLESSADDEERTIRDAAELRLSQPQFRAMAADRVRLSQILRGQMSSTKRVASKKALSQLQSVELDSLPNNERMCVICYNDYGQRTPEGIIEAPLRLPRCRHVFGDHCIKKWFEESDSCPYCRDKVPSEPAMVSHYRAVQSLLRSSQFRNRLPAESGPGTNLAQAQSEALMRLMMHEREQRDADRIMAHQDRPMDLTPPRPLQTGERRSPPSEGTENRRRTRARHGSFRSSQLAGTMATRVSTATPAAAPAAAPAPLQHHSPPRERAAASGFLPWPGSYSQDPGRSLTSFVASQSALARQVYEPGRPPNVGPPAERPRPDPMSMGPQTGGPMGVDVPPFAPFYGYYGVNPSPFQAGPSQVTYPLQLPPVGPLAGQGNPANPSIAGNGSSSTSAGEGWQQ